MKRSFLNYTRQLVMLTMSAILLYACNKDNLEAVPTETTPASGQTIAQLLEDPSFSLLKSAVEKAGMTQALADNTAVFTLFAPDNDALTRSGISAAVIAALPATQIASILQYHIVGGQKITSDQIPTGFPNLQLPTQLVLAPPSASLPPGLRMSLFPSKRATAAWANNVPLTAVDIQVANGIVHKTATVLLPPTVMLWNRIAADPNLTYLKAAVQRADETSPSPNLVAGLSNPAANLTVFAPTDAAMQQFLIGAITQALIAKGLPAANAQAAATALVTTYGTTIISNPASIPDAPIFPTGTGIGAALAAVLTPMQVAGIVSYHLLTNRAFTVNLPAVETAVSTALAANLPGATVDVQAVFGATGVTAATVQGLANATPSNIQINPVPGTGTSDQLCVNGVIHLIDQVLRPR